MLQLDDYEESTEFTIQCDLSATLVADVVNYLNQTPETTVFDTTTLEIEGRDMSCRDVILEDYGVVANAIIFKFTTA